MANSMANSNVQHYVQLQRINLQDAWGGVGRSQEELYLLYSLPNLRLNLRISQLLTN